MSWFPWVLSLVMGLAGAAGTWYYRRMWTVTRDALTATQDAGARWEALNDVQAKRLAEAVQKVDDLQAKEVKDDEATVNAAASDAARAAELLNSLHP